MTVIALPRRMLLLLAGLLALVASSGMAATQITAASGLAAPATYSISGRVAIAENPVAGVTITATGGYTTTTASDGTYSLDGLPEGTYTITPSKNDLVIAYYFDPPSRTVTVAPNATGQNFSVYILIQDYAIYGKVTTPSGEPIADVEILRGGNGGVKTGSDGAYTFFASYGEELTLVPRKQGYTFTPVSRRVSVPISAPVDFVGRATSIQSVCMPIVRLPCPSAFCGSVVIENGGVCCIGGRPGTTIGIPVSFRAASASGAISGMRIDNGLCNSLEPINTAWEPFDTQKVYTHTLSPGWETFDVRAQYRDEAGAVSKIYCADVALEGFEVP